MTRCQKLISPFKTLTAFSPRAQIVTHPYAQQYYIQVVTSFKFMANTESDIFVPISLYAILASFMNFLSLTMFLRFLVRMTGV